MEDTRDRALLNQTARQDGIRLERMKKENKCARDWQQNWGFLDDLYPKDSQKPDEAASPTASRKPRPYEIPQCALKASENSLNADLKFDEQAYAGGLYEWLARMAAMKPKEKYRAPLTSSQEIGWK